MRQLLIGIPVDMEMKISYTRKNMRQKRGAYQNEAYRGVNRLFSPFDSICAYQARLDLAHCRFGDSIVLLHVKIQSGVYVSLF